MEAPLKEAEALQMAHEHKLEEQMMHREKEKGNEVTDITANGNAKDLEAEQLEAKDVESEEEQLYSKLDDASNPRKWPKSRKWFIVILVTTTLSIDVLATTIVLPGAANILRDLGASNDHSYYVLLVSIWEIGEGVGSLFSGPLSEMLGRLPVYHTGNICFCLFAVACALSTNISMFIAFRFLCGFSTTALSLGPAIIGDLFVTEERGSAMAVNLAAPITFSLISPICGGYITGAIGWRWTQWIVVIASGALAATAILLMRETYAPILVKRKLAKVPGSSKDVVNSKELFTTLLQALTRPTKMFISSISLPLVAIFAAWAYGILISITTTLSLLMRHQYHFTTDQVGLTYLGSSVGMILSLIVYFNLSDRIVKLLSARQGGTKPEQRLYFCLAGAIILPMGNFIYGWTAQYHCFYIVPVIGTAVIGFGQCFTFISAENYIVDAYGDYSSSAVSAAVFVRALFGTVLPLAGPPLLRELGWGWGNSVWAFISIGFIPIIAFLTFKGEVVRNRDRFAKSDIHS